MRHRELVIATRRSPLALWQANHVKGLLEARGHTIRLLAVTTTGDRVIDRPLAKVGGKGLFLKEIENALQRGEADLAVHSLKDVPMEMPAGYALSVVLEREDPRDGLVSRMGLSIHDLPANSRIGTSSLRRAMMIRRMRRDLDIQFIRGNVDGRLAKLDRGEFDAIVLAVAGMRRLGLEHRLTQIFTPNEMLPAVGQGAIGIETLAGRDDVAKALAPLADLSTELCVTAERAVGRLMHASCSQPFAAHAHLRAGLLDLHASWGTDSLDIEVSAHASGPVDSIASASELGAVVASQLKSKAAGFLP